MKVIKTITLVGMVAGLANAATVTQGWDSSVDFGLTLTRGNSDTTLLTTTLNLAKSVGDDEYNAGLGYSYSEEDSSTISDELTGFLNWNRLVTETSYYGFRLEGRRDDIAKIDYRVQGTVLYGMYLLKNETSTFALELGPGYTVDSLDGVEENYAHAYLGQRASHWVSDNARIFQSFAGYLNVEDTERYNATFTIGAEALMSESLSLKVTLENKYESQPATGSKNNDLKLISGISYKF